MEFLFHTVLFFEGSPVYYNIYKKRTGFFAEILDNPGRIKQAVNFTFRNWEGEWFCSVRIEANVVEELVGKLG